MEVVASSDPIRIPATDCMNERWIQVGLAMKILIVEDEQEIAAIIQECLEAEGFSCQVCHDGHSADECLCTTY